MMEIRPADLRDFLLKAKQNTYAARAAESTPSRPNAHDLQFVGEDGWLYIDSYLGGRQFAGEEAVWKNEVPIWAMNYCGHTIGEGFDINFLKDALLHVPADAPYRGPIEYRQGRFLYVNTYSGELPWFFGREEIYADGVSVYECVYHGGLILP